MNEANDSVDEDDSVQFILDSKKKNFNSAFSFILSISSSEDI